MAVIKRSSLNQTENLNAASAELEKLFTSSAAIENIRNSLNSTMGELCSKRHVLYENLITISLIKYYTDSIFRNNKKLIALNTLANIFDKSSTENDFYLKLDNIALMSVLGEKTCLNNVYIEKLRSTADYFLDIFNNVKSLAGINDDISVTNNGIVFNDTIKHLENENLTGTLKLYDKNDVVLSSFSSDLSQVAYADITLNSAKDVIVQDGSNNFPTVISDAESFLYTFLNNRDSRKTYVLDCDIDITSEDMDGLSIFGTLDGNGHVLTFDGKDINIFGSLKNIQLELTNNSLLSKTKIIASKDGRIENIKVYAIKKGVHIEKEADEYGQIDSSWITGENFIYLSRELTNITFTNLTVDNDGKITSDVSKGKVDPGKSSFVAEYDRNATYEEPFKIESGYSILSNLRCQCKSEGSNCVSFSSGNDNVEFLLSKSGNQMFITFDKLNVTVSKDGVSYDVDFRGSTGSVLKLSSMNSEAIITDTLLSALADIASIAKVRYIPEHIICDPQFLTELKSNIAKLRTSGPKVRVELIKRLSELAKTIFTMAQSFFTIESNRASYDSLYDTTYTENIISNFNDIANLISTITVQYDSTLVQENFDTISELSELISDEITVLSIEISDAISRVNNVINEYIIFHKIDKNYGDDLVTAAVVTSDILTRTGAFTSSFNNEVYVPSNIRRYETWARSFRSFSNDGIINFVQLYIVHELCINLLGIDVSDGSDLNKSLKKISNDIIIKMCRNLLLFTHENNFIKIPELEIEKKLAKKGIYAAENAPNSMIPSQIILVAPILESIDKLDLSDLLISLGSTAATNDKTQGELPISIEKEILYVYMLLINYIFSNSNINQIINRITRLTNALKDCEKNFKSILIEYVFMDILSIMYNTVVSQDNANSNSISEFKKVGLHTVLEEILGVKTENENFVFTKFETVKDDILSYITVWLFKYYSEYNAAGSILYFLKFDNNDQRSAYDNIFNFLYKTNTLNYMDIKYANIKSEKFYTKIVNSINALYGKIKEYIKF